MNRFFVSLLILLLFVCNGWGYTIPERDNSFSIVYPDGATREEQLRSQIICDDIKHFKEIVQWGKYQTVPYCSIHHEKVECALCKEAIFYKAIYYSSTGGRISGIHVCENCFLFDRAASLWANKVLELEQKYQNALTEDQAQFYRKRLITAEQYRNKYKRLLSERLR